MSNPFKAIGKAFKAVVKVVKKIALPALAIGAVVLTGGAALGLLPSVGSLIGGLGLSPALTGILVGGAKAATMGAIGSALTGGSIIKGATTGFLMGGALGGLGAIASKAGGAIQNAAPVADAAQNATTATNAAGAATNVVQHAASAAPIAATSQPMALGGLGQIANATAPAVSSTVPAAAGTLSSTVPSSSSFLDSIFGGISGDPMTRALMVQGLGQGISAKAAADERKAEEEQIRANYSDTSGLFRLPSGQGQALPDAASVYNSRIYGNSKLQYDPRTNRVTAVGG